MADGFILADVPEKCNRCRFWFGKATIPVEYICMAEQRQLESIDRKPDWCPIQELPGRKEVMGIPRNPTIGDFERNAHQRGWNACRDQILGK